LASLRLSLDRHHLVRTLMDAVTGQGLGAQVAKEVVGHYLQIGCPIDNTAVRSVGLARLADHQDRSGFRVLVFVLHVTVE
jgi:hypothetical protein